MKNFLTTKFTTSLQRDPFKLDIVFKRISIEMKYPPLNDWTGL